jgi:hypothetical protein
VQGLPRALPEDGVIVAGGQPLAKDGEVIVAIAGRARVGVVVIVGGVGCAIVVSRGCCGHDSSLAANGGGGSAPGAGCHRFRGREIFPLSLLKTHREGQSETLEKILALLRGFFGGGHEL